MTPVFTLRVIVLLTPARTVTAYSVEAKQIEKKPNLKDQYVFIYGDKQRLLLKLTRKMYGGVYIYLKKRKIKIT